MNPLNPVWAHQCLGLGITTLQSFASFVSPQPVADQFNCFVNTLVVSSLSKAISQKPNSQASNSQPSDHKSRTLTTRPHGPPNMANKLKIKLELEWFYENPVSDHCHLSTWPTKASNLLDPIPSYHSQPLLTRSFLPSLLTQQLTPPYTCISSPNSFFLFSPHDQTNLSHQLLLCSSYRFRTRFLLPQRGTTYPPNHNSTNK